MLIKRSNISKNLKIHPTAIVEDNVVFGENTSVWDNVHIRSDTTIGDNCIVGEKTYIAYGVQIGNGVKINSFVYICAGVTIEDQVMISAGTVFTNDVLPRAFDVDGKSIKTSDPTEETLETSVCRGARHRLAGGRRLDQAQPQGRWLVGERRRGRHAVATV